MDKQTFSWYDAASGPVTALSQKKSKGVIQRGGYWEKLKRWVEKSEKSQVKVNVQMRHPQLVPKKCTNQAVLLVWAANKK